jgi:hypothetical protein
MSELRPKNSIKVSSRENYPTSFNLWSSNDFFRDNKEVVFENDEWGFSFRIASIDDVKGIRAVYDNSKSSYSLGLYDTNINTGVFYVDEEESNEDKIVFSY